MEYVSHEVRGLWLRVRLIKLVRGPDYTWPRLTRQTVRLPWLQYNLDTIGEIDVPIMHRKCTQFRAYSESSSDDGNVAANSDEYGDELDLDDEFHDEPNRVQATL